MWCYLSSTLHFLFLSHVWLAVLPFFFPEYSLSPKVLPNLFLAIGHLVFYYTNPSDTFSHSVYIATTVFLSDGDSRFLKKKKCSKCFFSNSLLGEIIEVLYTNHQGVGGNTDALEKCFFFHEKKC